MPKVIGTIALGIELFSRAYVIARLVSRMQRIGER